jgi:hypothetical protein
MNSSPKHWPWFQDGHSLGQAGPEAGVSLREAETNHENTSARITIEHDLKTAPFASTCGAPGLFVHTAYFGTQEDCDQAYADIKLRIDEIIRVSAEDAYPLILSLVRKYD